MAYMTPSSDLPFDCSTKSCPRGYICVKDVWNDKRKRPMLDPRTQQPKSCNVEYKQTCPRGFHCILNSEKNKFFCCGTVNRTETCPEGAKLVRFPITGEPMGCSSDTQCLKESACHHPDPFRTGLCCRNLNNCTIEINMTNRTVFNYTALIYCLVITVLFKPMLIGAGFTFSSNQPYIDEHRIFCSTNKSCPFSQFCIRRDSDRVGICCGYRKLVRDISTTKSKQNSPFKCPNDLVMLTDIRTNKAQICNSQLPCPAPYHCTTTNQQSLKHICCASLEALFRICEDGTVPLVINSTSYSCQSNSCPLGYKCVETICCPVKGQYYFDTQQQKCLPFKYRICDLQANAFIDEEACAKTCLAKGTYGINEIISKENNARQGKNNNIREHASTFNVNEETIRTYLHRLGKR
uniref:BPTI/Kunitz inhibitor domain-containing protein n=1 Tax=Heterorhabditis bacteriophora TaxID=37862 RepID=A0A1I7XAB6_HETBA